MSPPVHLAKRHWGRNGPQGQAVGHTTGHRSDGWRAARHCWVCIACRAWHEVHPGTQCGKPIETPGQGVGPCMSARFLHFDSKGEGLRYMQLWAMQDYGEICNGTLEHHPRWPLCAPGPDGRPVRVAWYEADAQYVLRDGRLVVEDWKPGPPEALDPVFKVKRRWFEAQYAPLTITLMSK